MQSFSRLLAVIITTSILFLQSRSSLILDLPKIYLSALSPLNSFQLSS